MKPYYSEKGTTIYHGDCRDVVRSLPDCSVDSVVTDPPYELGFMGKCWDRSGIAYDVEVWRECLRMLKPGGHLLAFGGSRTYHRLACAIEDAGFEIRDQIQYLYGSGFPKSLNVSKNLREQESVCICNEHDGGLLSLQNRISDVESVAETDQDTDMFPPVQREIARAGMGQARVQGSVSAKPGEPQSGSATRPQESGMERRRNLFSETRELRADQVRAMPAGLHADGSQGWVCDGAPPDHGPVDRATANKNGSGSPRRSQSSEQPTNEPAFMARQSEPQTSGAWPICGRCGKPVVPEGLGSALKPAHEPIVLARKPFNTTLIQNVLQHGTGGLNIDGCRIEIDESLPNYTKQGVAASGVTYQLGITPPGDHPDSVRHNASGRWPANVIHDGSEEVLAEFPETTSGDSEADRTSNKFANVYREYAGHGERMFRGASSGSAARFFYCAKASKKDRGEDNNHPTVKPTALMRYLCRLVTPPNGTVLDPFGGSGTTAKACALEGFNCILIEKETEYCEIAKHRAVVRRQEALNFEAVA